MTDVTSLDPAKELTAEDAEVFAGGYLKLLAERGVITRMFAELHSMVHDGNLDKETAFDTFSKFLLPVGIRAIEAHMAIPGLADVEDVVHEEILKEYDALVAGVSSVGESDKDEEEDK